MKKIVRLTESDLSKIVKKVIVEQKQIELVSQIINSPKLNRLVDNALAGASAKELINLKNGLISIGIDSETDPMTAISLADDLVDYDSMNMNLEMTEEDDGLSTKDKIMNGVYASLASLGVVNLVFLNIPISYLINSVLPELSKVGLDNQISFVVGLLLLVLGNRIKTKKTE
jgi:hypothetical protein